MPEAIEIIEFHAPVPYAEMLAHQYARRDAVQRGDSPNTLYLLEHTPTITLGRNSNPANLLLPRDDYAKRGIEVLEVDRGGDVTYHGPGQLVAYPILNLQQFTPSVGWYIRMLERSIIEFLAELGVEGEQMPGYTGVWVEGAKIAAIGIGVRNWVSYHGIAVNISPDMSHFSQIIPCGIADKPVVSLEHLLNPVPEIGQLREQYLKVFRTLFS